MKTLKILTFILALSLSTVAMAQHNFFMNIGYSYRLSGSPNERFGNQTKNSDHYNTLRNGLNLAFAYDYSVKPQWAFGFKADMFSSFNSLSDADEMAQNHDIECKDDEYIFYVGPTARYIFPTYKEKWTLSIRGTIGRMALRNSQTTLVQNPTTSKYSAASITYSGACFGFGADCMMDYKINEWLSLNGNIGYMYGSIRKLKAMDNSYTLKTKENLSRLSILAGVSIKL